MALPARLLALVAKVHRNWLGVHMQVPCLEERLSTYASSFEAAQQLEEALAVLAVHVDAQVELRASECFAVVLARTLAFGNFLNWGSRLGQAAGFRLKNLPKLQVYACSGCARSMPRDDLYLSTTCPHKARFACLQARHRPACQTDDACP